VTAAVTGRLTLSEYYRKPAVRRRIREYCGASGIDQPTCVYVTGLMPGDRLTWTESPARPAADLDRLLDAGAEVSRSMWDSQA
jgi:hypothetical protein